MKRSERHHLKEDQMVRGLSWMAQFFKTYRREFLMGAAALAVAALVFAALMLLRSHSHSVYSRVVGEVKTLVSDLDGKPANLAELEKLAEKRRYARLPNLELAKHWFGQGDLAKAESYLARIPAGRKDLLHYQIEDFRAQVLIRQKEFDRAIEIYTKMRDEKPKVYPLDAVLFHMAEALELRGDRKEALAIYREIQEEYTQTYYGYEASMRASRLALSQ